MKKDISYNEWTAIDELLKFVPEKNLINFLSEEDWDIFSNVNKARKKIIRDI